MDVTSVGEVDDQIPELTSRLAAVKENKYVAFVDLLGFGERVARDWAEAVTSYERFVRTATTLRHRSHRARFMPETLPEVQFWSDAAVIVGDDLRSVAEACQDIQTGALFAGVLVRGAVSKGAHAHVEHGRHAFVVSEALVRAVGLEKRAHYPRVLVDRDAGLADEARRHLQAGHGSFMFAEDGECMVLPFIPDWAKREPTEMFALYGPELDHLIASCQDPRHLPKYEWLRAQVGRAIDHFQALQEADPSNDYDYDPD